MGMTKMATETRQFEMDERLFVRVPYTTQVTYSDDGGHEGGATSDDISRGGVSLRMGRYLRPGRFVLITIGGPDGASPIELKTRVAWCRPDKGEHVFRTGLRVFYDEPDTMEQMSRLMYEAVLRGHTKRGDAIEVKPGRWMMAKHCAGITRGVIAASLSMTLGIVSYLSHGIA